MTRIVMTAAARTPFGRLGGALKEHSAVELGAHAVRSALARAQVAAQEVSETYFGSAVLAGSTLVMARQVGIRAGIPASTPSLTVDRACCSSMTAIGLARARIAAGDAGIVVAGGAESCSRTPFLQHHARWGKRLGDFTVEDPLQFRNPINGQPLARVTGEVALAHGVDRALQDDWAHQSHARYFEAFDRGFFGAEVAPVAVAGASDAVAADESPRRGLAREQLSALRTVYDSPSVTPGNAPGLNDGASAVVLMSEGEARRRNADVLCEVVRHVQIAGELDSSPYLPGQAIALLLQRQGLSLDEMHLLEINEAFAAMPLVSTQWLTDDKARLQRLRKITNVHGGAVALGHPTGASGARLAMTLAMALRERGGGWGVAAICGGFGNSDALLLKV